MSIRNEILRERERKRKKHTVSIIRLPLQVWDYLNNPAAPMLRNLKNLEEEKLVTLSAR